MTYHRIDFDTRVEAAAFVAALSRFVTSPQGTAGRDARLPVEIWAYRASSVDRITLYLSDSAVAATTRGFAFPPISESVVSPETIGSDGLLVLSPDSAALGRDEVLALLTSLRES